MEHLTQEQIEGYQAGTLGNSQGYREADAHVSICQFCRNRLLQPAEESKTELALLRMLEGSGHFPHHPSQDVLVDYAQNQAGIPSLAAAHIRGCEQCQEDVADLRAYMRGLEEARTTQKDAALPRRLPDFLGEFRSRLFFGGAMAAVAIVVLFFFVKSRPTVVINDAGGRWTLNGWGRLDAPVALPPTLQSAHLRALKSRQLETPVILASLRGTSDTLLSPTGRVVLSDRPTLTWKPPANATAATQYVCTIVSISNPRFKRPPSKPVKKPSWTLPPAKPPLPRGETYTWRVVAKTNGKATEITGAVATLPRFKVLAQERVTALEAAKRTYGRSHLTMALLYTQEGLLDEAEREFAALKQANPGSPEIEALQSRLNALRGAAS